MTFLNSFMICNSMVNLGREFKHLIKVGRFVHFNLKHSTTQFGTQNKPNSPEFKCFNKFQVFILLVIYLCSRQIENLEICVHKIFMEIKQRVECCCQGLGAERVGEKVVKGYKRPAVR